MEIIVENKKNGQPGMEDYRESIRKLINVEVRNALDEEMRKAVAALVEEQRKAVNQIVEEHREALKQVVDEEKKAIWGKMDLLRKSISQLGL